MPSTPVSAADRQPSYAVRGRPAARVALVAFAVTALAVTALSVTGLPVAAASKKATAKTVKSANKGPEVSPAGDIPDNQAFVPYTPKSGGYVVSVPEGWARTESGTATSFTDKLNTIRMDATNVSQAPTKATIATTELALIKGREPNVTGGKATVVTRKAGSAILLTYLRDSAANAVTGKVVREAVERYEFWRSGTQVTLTLSGPAGADNVDPWKIVTDSFSWKYAR